MSRWWESAIWTNWSAELYGTAAYAPSRCGMSTSAVCAAVMDEAIEFVTSGTAGFHLSFDMDSSTGICAGRGDARARRRTYREAHLAMEVACDSGRMLSMEVVEVNPVIDEVNRTADLAVELILSAMGRSSLR